MPLRPSPLSSSFGAGIQLKRAEYADGHPTAGNAETPLKDIKKKLPLRVLSEADWHQWTTKGYVIVRHAVDPELVQRLIDVLWDFDEKDPTRPDSWVSSDRLPHRMKELNGTGMLEIYHHQLMWDMRQSQRVYDIFVDIWDREDLWVVLDRANLNVPNPDQYAKPGFIHWDCDTSGCKVFSVFLAKMMRSVASNAYRSCLPIWKIGFLVSQKTEIHYALTSPGSSPNSCT